ncbi:hypothetical protein [Fibrella aquatilis]|uniref:Uncharacterized protein n=1 Tax=Fibrella aquatilis TaxID=2817059 RepID=A0A939G3H9_9BACT|nr:hypothetical protein [Fibrella aquatilis]MBO0929939.1 hypothetical protein [Fibrella aquatilis]
MSKQRLPLFITLGAFFWLNAALIIHFVGATVFSAHNPAMALAFAAAIPITVLSIYITRWVSGLAFGELLRPIVIMTFTATFLDGIALVWFRQLYADSFEIALHGAAWILWGVGLGLLAAFYGDVKDRNLSKTER